MKDHKTRIEGRASRAGQEKCSAPLTDFGRAVAKAEGQRLKAETNWISFEIEILNETERKIIYDDFGA